MSKIELTDEIKLDFDQKHPQKRLSIPRIKFIARLLRLKIRDVQAYRTSNGVHVIIKLDHTIHPITAVLIQALMGSDYAREAYNMIRAYNLTINPTKYAKTAHECWNVLFYKKYVDNELTSQEKPDPKLTKKLRRELMECT